MREELYEPLSREEVIKAVERKKPSRIPLVRAKWWGEGLNDQYGERLRECDRYPEDVSHCQIPNPATAGNMNLSWQWKTGGAHDASVVIDSWDKLDEFIEKLPHPENDPYLEKAITDAENARKENRYVMCGWWNLFFEKPWLLRGMQNIMCDYYTYKDNVHRLHAALANTYIEYIEYFAKHMQPDGFWASDDLGHQGGPMMSPEIFHELIYPYYVQVGNALKKHNIHFWLHSCGDNTLLLPDLIDAGLNVFHPVQKHTMDEKYVAEKFGNKLTFLAGIDVQHTLQEKDPEGVREEVRFLIDTFDQQGGGMCIAAGNGIVGGTPFENIIAFLDEAIVYGTKHRATRKFEVRSVKERVSAVSS